MRINSLRRCTLVLMLFSTAIISQNRANAAEKQDAAKPVFAFVALNELSRPTPEKVRIALEVVFAKERKISEIKVDDKAVTFAVDGHVAMYRFINRPIPWQDLEGPCQSSWIWTDAKQALKRHRAHLIVMYMGDQGSFLERNILLTKLLSAASSTFNTAGVYWGHGSVVLSPKLIRGMAEDASVESPPLLAWISFLRQKGPKGSFSIATEGLNYFDCMEIEVVESKQPAERILNAVMGVAHITIKGEVIEDGDTIGGDAQERIKTRHAKSVRGRQKKVIRVEI